MQVGGIRLGRISELSVLQEIERSAGLIFLEYDMADIANDDPCTIESLSAYCEDKRLWVAVDEHDKPIAYAIVDLVDGCAHVEQVSVHADYSGRKLGRTLIETVVQWAEERLLDAVTLTTFSDIPWNAPYYERLKFHRLVESELSPGLRRIRAEETRHGLDRWPRVCMRRNV